MDIYFQDIAGIVYTIYESIGKSVVVPHCGSKTINVRLTVSPDSKTKSAQHATVGANKLPVKRQRLKQRKLLKLDDDNDNDSGSICGFDALATECQPNADNQMPCARSAVTTTGDLQTTGPCKSNVYITERQQLENSATRTTSKDTTDSRLAACCMATTVEHMHTPPSQDSIPSSSQRRALTENIYECAPMVAAAVGIATPTVAPPKTKNDVACVRGPCICPFSSNLRRERESGECQRVLNGISSTRCPIDGNVLLGSGGKPSVRKLIRKSRSRKQKTHEVCHARIRSLSVGNEASFRNSSRRNGRTVDGIGGDASSGASGKERNAECLNNLRRNDLIDIIRESMEKNRLCFQSNG